MKVRLLDLFCGAGGASMGYHRAGFEVVGVDISPQPHYPFKFVQANAISVDLGGFDAIHASPPCQAYSQATVSHRGQDRSYPNLVGATRVRLERSGVPWVIENVPGAPIRPDLRLCGCMYGLPLLRRIRWFETSWHAFDLVSPCVHIGATMSIHGHSYGGNTRARRKVEAQLERIPNRDDYNKAMGIDWMTRKELGQAIPPAYTEHVGRLLMAELDRMRAENGILRGFGEQGGQIDPTDLSTAQN